MMYEETLVLLKPDALERRLVGRIIQRYEKEGLKIIDIRLFRRIDDDLIERHYPDTMALDIGRKAQNAMKNIDDPVVHGRKVLRWLRKYVTRGPVIALRIGGEDAINVVRRVTGFTDPSTAKKGTIRRELGVDSLKKATEEQRSCENLIHASGNAEEARKELSLWFPE